MIDLPIVLDITPPPSTNQLYANRKGGRYKTGKYKAWIARAGFQIKNQTFECDRLEAEVPVEVLITVPYNGRRDLDNYFKPILDLLVSMNLIPDDNMKHLRRIEARIREKFVATHLDNICYIRIRESRNAD